MVADLIEQPKRQSQRQYLRDQLHTLALCIGLRAAARKLGVKEKTACTWSIRGKWNLPQVFKLTNDKPALSGRTPKVDQNALAANGGSAHAILEATLREHSDDSRLYLASAGLKASYEAAQLNGVHLLTKETSQSVLNHARSLDVVHGWSAARATGVSVQIANVILPTPQEEAKRDALHAKLDEITRRLAERSASHKATQT